MMKTNLTDAMWPRFSRGRILLAALLCTVVLLSGLEAIAAAPAAATNQAGATATDHVAPVHQEVTLLKQFAYSYLTAYMFFLSICLGSLFLIIMHHLFDAGWSVPIRRSLEHIAFLLPWMGVLFIPIALLAKTIYPWMTIDPNADHALHVKKVLFNQPTFYVVAIILFLVWTWLSYGLRKWSLEQDRTGAARCTIILRRYSAGGIFIFAFTLTLAAIYWMKSLQHQFFSTMYGVYYFAGSVWVTLATVYLLVMKLRNDGPLRAVVHRRQFHDIGQLLLVFTVFYAYIHFSQYFLIWNAAIPEETFWYVLREKGSWWEIGLLIIFGHFLLPFLCLLRIDAKLSFPVIVPVCIWAWLMHYADMSFNIMPVLHPNGFVLHLLDLVCIALIGFILSTIFFRQFRSHPPYPLKDPRLKEALTVHDEGASPLAIANQEGLK